MQKIYKYASMSSALKIIANESVLLNRPSEFNDPFDSKINIIEKNKKRCLDLIYNYGLFTAFDDCINSLNLKISI